MSDAAKQPEDQEDPKDQEGQAAGGSFWVSFLEQIDAIPYGIVGAVFWVAALLSLAYGLSAFVLQIQAQTQSPNGFMPQLLIDQGQGAQDVIALVSDLLLTLIIMEVFGTVVHYLRERETTLRPFLFIGIISATRGILSIGARLAVGSVPPDEFVRDMVELGVDGAVIIALAVAMNLIGTFLDQGATPPRARQTTSDTSQRKDRQLTSSAATSSVKPARILPTGWAKWAVVALIVLIVLLSLGLIVMLLSTANF